MRDVWPVPVKNTSGQSCPPFGILQISSTTTTADGLLIHNVTRPTGGDGQYLVNGPTELVAGSSGSARAATPVVVAYTGSTPTIGDDWGPVANSFLAQSSGSGFIIQGVNTSQGTIICGQTRVQGGVDHPVVKVFNAGSVTIPARSVVGLSEPQDAVTDLPNFLSRVPRMKAGTVTSSGPFAITLADVPAGASGDAACVGVVQCRLNFTDAAHTRCGPSAGNATRLASGATGPAEIVWREKQGTSGGASLGEQWALVLIDRQGAGGGEATIVGTIGRISDASFGTDNDIDGAEEITVVEIVPLEVRDEIKAANPFVTDATKAWACKGGFVEILNIWQVKDDNGETTGVYLIPKYDEQGELVRETWWNMVPLPLAAGHLVQAKTIGGVSFIDVEGCN